MIKLNKKNNLLGKVFFSSNLLKKTQIHKFLRINCFINNNFVFFRCSSFSVKNKSLINLWNIRNRGKKIIRWNEQNQKNSVTSTKNPILFKNMNLKNYLSITKFKNQNLLPNEYNYLLRFSDILTKKINLVTNNKSLKQEIALKTAECSPLEINFFLNTKITLKQKQKKPPRFSLWSREADKVSPFGGSTKWIAIEPLLSNEEKNIKENFANQKINNALLEEPKNNKNISIQENIKIKKSLTQLALNRLKDPLINSKNGFLKKTFLINKLEKNFTLTNLKLNFQKPSSPYVEQFKNFTSSNLFRDNPLSVVFIKKKKNPSLFSGFFPTSKVDWKGTKKNDKMRTLLISKGTHEREESLYSESTLFFKNTFNFYNAKKGSSIFYRSTNEANFVSISSQPESRKDLQQNTIKETDKKFQKAKIFLLTNLFEKEIKQNRFHFNFNNVFSHFNKIKQNKNNGIESKTNYDISYKRKSSQIFPELISDFFLFRTNYRIKKTKQNYIEVVSRGEEVGPSFSVPKGERDTEGKTKKGNNVKAGYSPKETGKFQGTWFPKIAQSYNKSYRKKKKNRGFQVESYDAINFNKNRYLYKEIQENKKTPGFFFYWLIPFAGFMISASKLNIHLKPSLFLFNSGLNSLEIQTKQNLNLFIPLLTKSNIEDLENKTFITNFYRNKNSLLKEKNLHNFDNKNKKLTFLLVAKQKTICLKQFQLTNFLFNNLKTIFGNQTQVMPVPKIKNFDKNQQFIALGDVFQAHTLSNIKFSNHLSSQKTTMPLYIQPFSEKHFINSLRSESNVFLNHPKISYYSTYFCLENLLKYKNTERHLAKLADFQPFLKFEKFFFLNSTKKNSIKIDFGNPMVFINNNQKNETSFRVKSNKKQVLNVSYEIPLDSSPLPQRGQPGFVPTGFLPQRGQADKVDAIEPLSNPGYKYKNFFKDRRWSSRKAYGNSLLINVKPLRICKKNFLQIKAEFKQIKLNYLFKNLKRRVNQISYFNILNNPNQQNLTKKIFDFNSQEEFLRKNKINLKQIVLKMNHPIVYSVPKVNRFPKGDNKEKIKYHKSSKKILNSTFIFKKENSLNTFFKINKLNQQSYTKKIPTKTPYFRNIQLTNGNRGSSPQGSFPRGDKRTKWTPSSPRGDKQTKWTPSNPFGLRKADKGEGTQLAFHDSIQNQKNLPFNKKMFFISKSTRNCKMVYSRIPLSSVKTLSPLFGKYINFILQNIIKSKLCLQIKNNEQLFREKFIFHPYFDLRPPYVPTPLKAFYDLEGSPHRVPSPEGTSVQSGTLRKTGTASNLSLNKKSYINRTPFLEKLIRTFFSNGFLNKQIKKASSIEFSSIPHKFNITKNGKNTIIDINNNLIKLFSLKDKQNQLYYLQKRLLMLERNSHFIHQTQFRSFPYEKKTSLKKKEIHRKKKLDSFRLLLKSQKFFKKSASLINKQKGYKEKLVLKHNKQKKHRFKKRKKFNLSRKKRKRFYPRPLWLRYRTYLRWLITKKANLTSLNYRPTKQIQKNIGLSTFDLVDYVVPYRNRKMTEINFVKNNDRRIPNFQTFNYKISNLITKNLSNKFSGSSIKQKNLQNYFKRIKEYLIKIRAAAPIDFDGIFFNTNSLSNSGFAELRSNGSFADRLYRINNIRTRINSSKFYKNQIKDIQNKEEYNRLISARIQKIIQISSILDISKENNKNKSKDSITSHLLNTSKINEKLTASSLLPSKIGTVSFGARSPFPQTGIPAIPTRLPFTVEGEENEALVTYNVNSKRESQMKVYKQGHKKISLFSVRYTQISSKDPGNNQTGPKRVKDLKTKSVLQNTWVWLYNIGYGNFCWSSITGLNSFELPNQTKTIPISWALKKTNTWFFGKLATKAKIEYKNNNQNNNLWSLQKLKNQSKSNKTKYLQKKISSSFQAMLSGEKFLKNFLLKSSIPKKQNQNESSSSVRRSFSRTLPHLPFWGQPGFVPTGFLPQRGQADKVDAIEPQRGQADKVSPFGGSSPQGKKWTAIEPQRGRQGSDRQNNQKQKYMNFFTHTKSKDFHYKMLQKWKKKEQKIFYLGEQKFTLASMKNKTNKHSLTFLKNQILNKNLVKPQKNLIRSKNFWFNDFNLVNSILSKKKKIHFFPLLESLGNPVSFDVTGGKEEMFSKSCYVFYSLVFHFCTLLSLMSLFQIRSYIRFHLLILFKVSKNSKNLIKSIFNSIKIFINNKMNYISKMFLQKTDTLEYQKKKLLGISNKSLNQVHHKKLTLFFQKSFLIENKVENLNDFIYNKKNQKFLKNVDNLKNQSKIIKLFIQTNTQKKSRKFLFKEIQKKKLNYKNDTIYFQRFFNKKLYSSFVKSIPSPSTVNGSPVGTAGIPLWGFVPFPFGDREEADSLRAPKGTNNETNQLINPKEFMFNQNLILISKLAILNLIDLKTKNNILLSHSLIKLRNKFSFNLKNLTKSKIFIILKNQFQIPKHIFNLISNSFRNFLKIMGSLFKNPENVINDVIGNAFLLEWTVDFQLLIPENIEVFMWNKFSIESNQIKRNFKINLLFINLFSRSVPFTDKENWKGFVLSPLENILLFSFITGFLKRTISPLIYSFFQILSEPDTDLILRQKKGTIFLDNWSEILRRAAEKYNITIPSLTILKDEQTKFMQKIIDSSYLKTSLERFNSKKIDNSISFQKNRFTYNFDLLRNSNNAKDLIQFENHKEKNQSLFLGLKNSKIMVPAIKKRNKVKFEQNSYLNSILLNGFSDSWPVNQFITQHSKETDLFIDFHPSKSFSHISAIKYYRQIQQPLGNLVCSIYSGNFIKQPAKNILIIGQSAFEKTLLITAFAGETELKMITDNATRYAVVDSGVAVGLRLLRDVFEALIFHAPCLFLLENIHIIGEKRSLIFSDSSNTIEEGILGDDSLGFQKVEEQNKISAENSNHLIKHYRKPYKGEFSSAISTNYFNYELFASDELFSNKLKESFSLSIGQNNLKSQNQKNPIKIKNSNILNQIQPYFLKSGIENPNSISNFASITNLSLDKTSSLKKRWSLHKNPSTYREENTETILESSDNINGIGLSLKKLLKRETFQKFTRLNTLSIKPDPLLIPPATSPLHVFAINEQKKFQPKKTVKELPFEGLSSEQANLVPQYTYSIRTKIALLTENALLNMSVKLELITDLLIILDSVRSNQGFIVFATTHVPSLLDPALRRPGRLDETIRIPKVQNIWSRWKIFKTTFNHFFKPLNYKISIFSDTFKETSSIYTNDFLLKANICTIDFIGTNSTTKNFINLMKNGLTSFNKQSILESSSFYKSNFLNSTVLKYSSSLLENKINKNYSVPLDFPFGNRGSSPQGSAKRTKWTPSSPSSLPHSGQGTAGGAVNGSSFGLRDADSHRAPSIKKNEVGPVRKPMDINSFVQSPKANLTEILVDGYPKQSLLSLDQKLFKSYKIKALTYFDVGKKLIKTKISYNISSLDRTLPGQNDFNETFNLFEEIQVATLYSNKTLLKSFLTKLFAGKICESFAFSNIKKFNYNMGSNAKETSEAISIDLTSKSLTKGLIKKNLRTILNNTDFSSGLDKYIPRGFQTLYGLDATWTASTAIVFSLIQKRYMFNKNLIIPNLLTFKGPGTFSESPPESFVLLPGKRYENYKRALGTFEKKAEITVGEKIQIHQQKRFLMRLYKIQVPEVFRSETISFANNRNFKGISEKGNISLNNKVQFANVFLTLNPIQKVCHKISATNFQYRHKILNRHRQYLTNQWWSQQLAEYNSEAVFLSDVDWRYTFIDSIGEFLIDYPDTDQIFKGQQNLGFENSWFNLTQVKNIEIFQHFILESFVKGFNYLDKNREYLDYSAYKYQKKGFLNENHLINIFKRFSN